MPVTFLLKGFIRTVCIHLIVTITQPETALTQRRLAIHGDFVLNRPPCLTLVVH